MKQRKPKPTLAKPKGKTKTKLRKELDTLFSRFIRLRDSNKEGIAKCYTCPKRDHWKKMQCGHFVPRQYLILRYDEVNCHVQCYACNMLYNGQPSAYAARLEREYGKGTVELLESKRSKVVTDFPYEELLVIYTENMAQFRRIPGFE